MAVVARAPGEPEILGAVSGFFGAFGDAATCRILMNLVIIAAAMGVTYLIGALTRTWWGTSV